MNMEHLNSEPQRTSKMAIASLLMSFLSCCSVCGVVPIALSIIAIIRIRLNPALRGMGIAVIALILNTGLTIASSVWILPQAKQLFQQVFGLMLTGPADAIRAGQTGDVEAFLAVMDRTGPTAPTTEEASVFLAALTERFGRVQSSTLQDPNRAAPPPGAKDVTLDYLLTFSNDGTVTAIRCSVLWQLADAKGDLDVKIRRIRVFADDMELAFPARAARGGAAGGGGARAGDGDDGDEDEDDDDGEDDDGNG